MTDECERRLAALEAAIQLSVRVNADLERTVRAQLDAVQRGLGELAEMRRASERQHPAGAAMTGLLHSLGTDPWARRILAVLLAIIALSMLSVHPGSPLFPLFALAERYIDRSADAQ